jgi:3-oxoacyl-[acyl-carrier-protein] synthase-1
MAVPAIRDCLKAFQVQDASHIVLLLGVRDTFRTHPNLDGRDSEMVAAIEAALRIRFHEDSSIVPEGRPAALLSLSRAGELLKNDGIEGCIVGGVDCMANWHDFRRFSASYRIRREDVPAGFIPGEGATFVAVARHHLVPRGTVEALEIVSVGIGHEDPGTTILSDGFPTGQGLYQALDTTLRQVDVSEGSIDFRVSDINGEHYRAVEAMLGVTRFYRTRREHLTTWIPAASTGDIGAAFGALLMIMAMTGMTKAYAPGSLAMCESCSDTGLVATCLVRHAAKQ